MTGWIAGLLALVTGRTAEPPAQQSAEDRSTAKSTGNFSNMEGLRKDVFNKQIAKAREQWERGRHNSEPPPVEEQHAVIVDFLKRHNLLSRHAVLNDMRPSDIRAVAQENEIAPDLDNIIEDRDAKGRPAMLELFALVRDSAVSARMGGRDGCITRKIRGYNFTAYYGEILFVDPPKKPKP